MLLELVSDEIDHGNLVANPRFAKGLLNHHAKHRSDKAQPIFKNRCPNSKEVSQSFLKAKLSDLTLHSQTSQFTKKNSTHQKNRESNLRICPAFSFMTLMACAIALVSSSRIWLRCLKSLSRASQLAFSSAK